MDRRSRGLRWTPWALLGVLALAWGYYAAPINLTKRIRSAAAAPVANSLVAARVDFPSVNAQLSDELRRATGGRLDAKSFSHLLLYGWLPQQRQKATAAIGLPASAGQTRLYQIRYKGLNRFIAIFWDAHQVHEVVLTLERESPVHRWRVTKVVQFNTCGYAFDCPQVRIADLGSTPDVGPIAPPRVDAHERSAARDQ